MDIKKSQVKKAGVKYIDLASALNITPAMVAQLPDEIPHKYQYLLRFGSKEAQAIRRKVLRHLKRIENE